MRLKLVRTERLPDKTRGVLSIDGKFICHTLEDVDRKLETGGKKVYGETAIPTGEYPVVLDFSARFKRTLPHVMAVKEFTGIRIHAGNTVADTDGCILVGEVRTHQGVGLSRMAMENLMNHLTKATDPITLEVV